MRMAIPIIEKADGIMESFVVCVCGFLDHVFSIAIANLENRDDSCKKMLTRRFQSFLTKLSSWLQGKTGCLLYV
jgi:hypothetical protein